MCSVLVANNFHTTTRYFTVNCIVDIGDKRSNARCNSDAILYQVISSFVKQSHRIARHL